MAEFIELSRCYKRTTRQCVMGSTSDLRYYFYAYAETVNSESQIASQIPVLIFDFAAPHAVAMEFDLFGERRSNHWVKGAGSAKGNFWLDSALENRTIASPTPVWVS
jgi:hypothetical protein